MFTIAAGSHQKKFVPLPLVTLLFVPFLFSLTSQAQTDIKLDAGNGGRNTLQGDVYTVSGQRLDRSVLVRLGTMRGEISTTTNGNGSFVFRNLAAGRYEIHIDPGGDYQAANEQVEIRESAAGGQMGRPGQIQIVQIHLRLKPGSSTKASVVAANDPPKEALDLYDKALQSVSAGKRERAIKELKEAIAIHPSFSAALNGLGVQYMKLGDLPKAWEAFDSALKLTPDSFILNLNGGIVLVGLRKFAEAEAVLQKATHLKDNSGPAHLYRARALIGLNRLDEAAKDLKRALSIGGDDVVAAHRYLGGIYMERGENVKAVEELELYLKLSPDSQEKDRIKALVKDLNLKSSAQKK